MASGTVQPDVRSMAHALKGTGYTLDIDLQILTRSVSGVTLTTQSPEGLKLQAKLMKENGTSWDRNFDYMNDVRNLINTGKPIVESGMHHQVCIALMGLPFYSDKVHTAEFYIDIGKRLLESDLHIDSICLKDASGTIGRLGTGSYWELCTSRIPEAS